MLYDYNMLYDTEHVLYNMLYNVELLGTAFMFQATTFK